MCEKKKITERDSKLSKKTLKTPIEIPPLNIVDLLILNDYYEIKLPPGVYELIDINNTTQKTIESFIGLNINIEADTMSMISVLPTSNPIYFTCELNTLLGFTNKGYPEGTHKSEKPGMITTTGKVHLKSDCLEG